MSDQPHPDALHHPISINDLLNAATRVTPFAPEHVSSLLTGFVTTLGLNQVVKASHSEPEPMGDPLVPNKQLEDVMTSLNALATSSPGALGVLSKLLLPEKFSEQPLLRVSEYGITVAIPSSAIPPELWVQVKPILEGIALLTSLRSGGEHKEGHS